MTNAYRIAVMTLSLIGGGCSFIAPSGDRYTHRFASPAADAASCFARNAEAHSSALRADVSRNERGAMTVLVSVKNGVTYAVARIEPQASGSAGTIELHVTSSGGNRLLLDALVDGC